MECHSDTCWYHCRYFELIFVQGEKWSLDKTRKEIFMTSYFKRSKDPKLWRHIKWLKITRYLRGVAKNWCLQRCGDDVATMWRAPDDGIIETQRIYVAPKRTPATARHLTGPQEARHFPKMTVPGESEWLWATSYIASELGMIISLSTTEYKLAVLALTNFRELAKFHRDGRW
jgi:hypothetical protein